MHQFVGKYCSGNSESHEEDEERNVQVRESDDNGVVAVVFLRRFVRVLEPLVVETSVVESSDYLINSRQEWRT